MGEALRSTACVFEHAELEILSTNDANSVYSPAKILGDIIEGEFNYNHSSLCRHSHTLYKGNKSYATRRACVRMVKVGCITSL